MKNPFVAVTLEFWHGGQFRIVANGHLVYEGGKGSTREISPDEICYWDLILLAREVSNGKTVEGVYYLILGLSMENGLRKVILHVVSSVLANAEHRHCGILKTSIKTDAITSNMAETFNGNIINAKTKHLLYMLEEIRTALM
uniref:PB1-like domain-containing protein n=1 Tax=Chenopodium quinoa TaxID=63459 RepID=A0A803MIV1_CHEQI